jgi:hypothetical protein
MKINLRFERVKWAIWEASGMVWDELALHRAAVAALRAVKKRD